MDQKKREKIIGCAIEEFAAQSYQNASTNHIVTRAGISKGLLFHYFGSKKTLYNETIVFGVKKLAEMTEKEIDWEERDIFERIRQSTMVRIKLAFQFPYLHQMLINAIKEENIPLTAKPLLALAKKKNVDVQYIFDKMFHDNIDRSRFNPRNNIELSIQMIQWAMEKYAESVFDRLTRDMPLTDLEQIKKELDAYIQTLRTAFYTAS